MKRRKTPFTQEDRVLWKRVADTTTPLSPQRGKFLKDEMAKLMDQNAPTSELPTISRAAKPMSYRVPQAPAPNLAGRGSLANHPIEERTIKKLAKGRQPIDARIDLHGMTQDRARFALLDFLQMAQRADYRIVLVITGKGNEGLGVLRRNVPEWLRLPAFVSLVNGFQQSHTSHGGEGALYVRIRKPTGGRSR